MRIVKLGDIRVDTQKVYRILPNASVIYKPEDEIPNVKLWLLWEYAMTESKFRKNRLVLLDNMTVLVDKVEGMRFGFVRIVGDKGGRLEVTGKLLETPEVEYTTRSDGRRWGILRFKLNKGRVEDKKEVDILEIGFDASSKRRVHNINQQLDHFHAVTKRVLRLKRRPDNQQNMSMQSSYYRSFSFYRNYGMQIIGIALTVLVFALLLTVIDN